MQGFQRNISICESLYVGIHTLIPSLLKNSEYNHTDYRSVLEWSIENNRLDVFIYIMSLKNKKYYSHIVKLNKYDITGLLWDSICEQRSDFVKVILKNKKLFNKIELDLDRKHIRVPRKNTRSGFVIYMAIGLYYWKASSLNNENIANQLRNYYEKEISNLNK
jgi:hypothetical protein